MSPLQAPPVARHLPDDVDEQVALDGFDAFVQRCFVVVAADLDSTLVDDRAGVDATVDDVHRASGDPDAVVESVEFLLTPAQAAKLRERTTALLGAPTSLACAGRSISETDSVIEWGRTARGGVLFTVPYRRLNGEPPVARLFVYSSRWDPSRMLSGYGVRTCDD